jgi:hypothetical protein
MRGAILVTAVLLHAHVATHRPAPEAATAVPVARIDSLMATEKGGRLTIEAKGAVTGGGWKHAALKPIKSIAPGDAHVLVLDFVAEPPEPTQAVIPGLLPVSAAITLNARKGLVSVRAVSASNDITTQILK